MAEVTPKPLSKERREEIEREYLEPSSDDACLSPDGYATEAIYIGILRDVLEDATYWREAVKNAPETDSNDCDGMFSPICLFCDAEEYTEPFTHKPDCPWLLAQ